MAQNARGSALTDELIQSILGFDPATNRQAYKHAKDIASRGLRGYQHARTNQFDVVSTYAGLDEKFRVKKRDDLADALKTRLQKLEARASKFTPDILSFLLLLSDRPLENTKVEALELLRPPSPELPLTWDEILENDPYSDEDIWKDIDYAVESSGDEQASKKRAKAKVSPPTSVDEDDTYDPTACVLSTEENLSKDLEAAQFWNTSSESDGSVTEITELQMLRETLFMLAGLRTSLYKLDPQQSSIRINPKYVLASAMSNTVQHLLSELVNIGRNVYRLRQWTKRSQTLPLIQTFESTVRMRLVAFDRALADVQQRYLTPNSPAAVSLLQLHTEVRSMSAPLLRLAHLTSDVEVALLVNPFSHLEALFDQINLAQMTLEIRSFQYLSSVFFDCLQTYLKPIRKWMEAGELGANDETFFVFESDSGSDAASLWHDRYVLRRDAQNSLQCPSFLQPAVKKIFNTGKSIIFLKELGIRGAGAQPFGSEPRLDHESVCGLSDDVPVPPFAELFQAAFDRWMQSKYSQASSVLREHLVETSGLMRTSVILETLYLGKNGAVFEDFANALFERMDGGRRGWNDRYVLTEITRTIFGTVMPHQDAERIVARSSKVKATSQSVKDLAAVSLDFALSWPIQNIIQRSSLPVYQQVLTFLLQSYRAKYLLQRARPGRGPQLKSARIQLTYKLQHRVTWFADILRSYLTETVIFFTTRAMDAQMEKAEDIDEMAQAHLRYVTNLQTRALLSKDVKPIHKAVIEMLDLSVLFAKTLASTRDQSTKVVIPRKTRSMWQRDTTLIAATAELSDSDPGSDAEDDHHETVDEAAQRSPMESLRYIDSEFDRLLPFITAGLRSVGRVGAEPMWEQLAERLEWKDKKLRT
ncbi:spindle pole body subunit [Parastagonospora nodorum]|nr:spindle pole body subunit [Parastagonospora nodorum]KAH4944020.1 spindle pole body subunit [Parastagonospora nodorum]